MEHPTGIKNLTLRTASRDDVPVILQFIEALADYEKMRDQCNATAEKLESSLFDRGRAEVLLAELGGRPVGFALYFFNYSTFEASECLYLEDLFIYEEYRGRGFGKAIFRALAAIALERGCPRFDWVCLDWNTSSIAFYKSLGAHPLDDWTIYRLSGPALRQVADKNDEAQP